MDLLLDNLVLLLGFHKKSWLILSASFSFSHCCWYYLVDSKREQDASDRDRQRYKSQLDLTGSEKGQLEKLRLQLNEQVNAHNHPCGALLFCMLYKSTN